MPQIEFITVPKAVILDVSYAVVVLSQIIARRHHDLSDEDFERLTYVSKLMTQARKDLNIIPDKLN